MIKICPLTDYQINEKVPRLNAFFSLIVLILFVFSNIKLPIIILAIDFFLRGFFKGKYSIISALSKYLLELFKIKPTMIDAGQKMFAARIGFLFCFLISIFYLVNLISIATILSIIIIILFSLELFFGFCLGCKTYSLLRSLGF
ncbi:DUF4395 domain-containing protein [Patescibacteria group bacterium]